MEWLFSSSGNSIVPSLPFYLSGILRHCQNSSNSLLRLRLLNHRFLSDFPSYLLAADGARPVSCFRLLRLARHVTPGRLQLQITNAARSAPSLRYGARPLANSRQTAHQFAFLPRADAREFWYILSARTAPLLGHIDRHARTDSQIIVYYLPFSLQKRAKR